MERIASMRLILALAVFCVALSAHLSAGQNAPAPGPSCNSAVVQLYPCLNFLTNDSVTTVAPICCAALTNVSNTSPACLCQFIAPGNANQSAQLGINSTRALELPSLCGLTVSAASCVGLGGPVSAPVPSAVAPAAPPTPITPAPTTPAPTTPAPTTPAPTTPAPTAPAPTGTPPVVSPATSIVPTPAPGAGVPSTSPVSSPESSAAPGPAADCNSEISALTPCLKYLTGNETSPSTDCCTNLGDVVEAAPTCLCSLVSSSNSPITGINSTLVLQLPSLCQVPYSLSECSAGLAPSSLPPSSGPAPQNSSGVRLGSSVRLYMVVALFVAAMAHTLLKGVMHL